MTANLLEEAKQIMQQADCIHDETAIQHAVEKMADLINRDLADKDPLILCVMNGGLMPTSLLIQKFSFPFKMDYLHATRYREQTEGAELSWQRLPEHTLRNRHVLVIDDILDEGYTLEAIISHCEAQEPASLRTAVLVQKEHERGVRPALDYVGLTVPDRYVFGCGMDYKGYWRNIPAIYAVGEAY